MSGFSMTVSGAKEVQATMRGIGKRAKDLTAPLNVIGERMLMSTEQNFREGGRPKKWEPSQRVKKSGGKTLVISGRLKNSVAKKVDSKSLRIGTNLGYAAPNQFGATGTAAVRAHKRKIQTAFGKKIAPTEVEVRAHTRKMNLPARPFIVLQKSDEAYRDRILLKYLLGGSQGGLR